MCDQYAKEMHVIVSLTSIIEIVMDCVLETPRSKTWHGLMQRLS